MQTINRYRVTPPALDRDGMIYWAGEQFHRDCQERGVAYREPSMLMSGWDNERVVLRDQFHGVLAVYRYGVDRDGYVWFEQDPKYR